MTSVAADSLSQTLAAINTLYNVPGSSAKHQADEWLQAFQTKPEAWQTAMLLLTDDTAGKEAHVFGAQTIRRKVVDDFYELDTASRMSLRDSLLNLIMQHRTSPRVVRTQLCLSLAGLALRLLDWENPVAFMIKNFSGSTEDVANLLEFLTVLPDEVNDNKNSSLTDEEYKARANELLTCTANDMLQLLIMYMQNSGEDTKIQEAVLRCFLSWLRSGDIPVPSLLNNPLVVNSFKALAYPELFDIAVSVVCELIYQTKDVDESMPVIQQIYPMLMPLRQEIQQNIADENEDNVRGYCRIFVEAGEDYLPLVVKHTDHFRGIVEGIAQCTAFHELEIVPMTFRFWYNLACELRHDDEARLKYQDVYETLVDVMMGHLRYPDSLDSWTTKERDDFKDFRHVMGDVLKDCCVILGSRVTLGKAYRRITEAASKPTPKWQEVEAPLMALRSMGSQVESDENEVMPQIMHLLSQLPAHPKIRYAATLVIARYGTWTDKHPEFIEYQLSFISSGFEDDEVVAASALAMKLLCKECSSHLLNYLQQLHTFFVNVTKRLKGMDLLEVTEAVAHVIAALPNTELSNIFQMFCLPIAQQLATLASRGPNVSENEIFQMCDNLSQLKIFFETVNPQVSPSDPHPCVPIFQELWPILETVADQFGNNEDIAKPLAGCMRSAVISYRDHFTPLLPSLLNRLVRSFEQTGLGQYLWVGSRVVREFGKTDPTMTVQFVESVSTTMWQILQKYAGQFNQIPDVVEDYFNLVGDLMIACPSEYLHSSLFATVFSATVACFTLKEQYTLLAVMRYCRILLDYANDLHQASTGRTSSNSSSSSSSPSPAQMDPAVAALDLGLVSKMFMDQGAVFITQLIHGMVLHFPPDLATDVGGIVKAVAMFMPQESTVWYSKAIEALDMSPMDKQKTTTDFSTAVANRNYTRARSVVNDFANLYRRKHNTGSRGRRRD
ncbi:Nuclear import receptor [Actinomortierella ambigua]|uniref:Nuclear import receptor n=1 Tax=Actinomortierella ambigua TaxID=1343610 RepID=A0A9P6U5N4_9FUNG|nr:Nuclear import receptor [Actinomortierella ambigua]